LRNFWGYFLRNFNEKTIVEDMNLKTGVIYACFVEWVKQYMTNEMIPKQRQFVYKIKKYR